MPKHLFPVGRWVHLKARLHLSESADGQVQLWQDDRKLIDEQGQTLPLAGAIYDSLKIGISAHSFGPNPATVYVDDVAAILTKTDIANTKKRRPRLEMMAAEDKALEYKAIELDIHEWSRILLALCGT